MESHFRSEVVQASPGHRPETRGTPRPDSPAGVGWGVPKIILGQGALLLNCLERCYLAGSWETPSLITISQEKEMLIS